MADATSTAQARQRSPEPGPEHKRLEVFIGKWINEGQTVADAPARKTLTSDVYEWMPGTFFVLHTANGRIGNMEVGGSRSSATTRRANRTAHTASTAEATSARMTRSAG